MSRLFGRIAQNGYVVRDVRAAMDHWIDVMGVGPWFYFDRVKIDYFRHRGEDSNLEMSAALANPGDIQIELIQQRNDAPSCTRSSSTPAAKAFSTWRIGQRSTRSSTTACFLLDTRWGTRVRSAASRAASPTSTLNSIPAP